MANETEPTLGNGKICYVEIPSADPQAAADFYQAVFGWKVRKRGDGHLAFDDGVGQVSGSWVTGRPPGTTTGVLVYIMVDDMDAILTAIKNNGGTIVQEVGADWPEITARFSDPFGNIFGVFHQR